MSQIEPWPLCVGMALAIVVGCTNDASPTPATLIDGSPVPPSPVVLDGVGGAHVATRVRRVRGSSPRGPLVSVSCASVARPSGPVVERTGVSGASVTFFDPGHRGVHACDATGLDRSGAERWCAHAYGRISGARLRDPRLSITCRDAKGVPIGFAWVQPSVATTHVVVQQPGYAEVYATSGRAPVRVTTADVDLASSSATFSISEHAEDGTRVRSYELEAQVAG